MLNKLVSHLWLPLLVMLFNSFSVFPAPIYFLRLSCLRFLPSCFIFPPEDVAKCVCVCVCVCVYWTSLVAQTVKRLFTMQETWFRSLGWEDPLEKEMAIHSSTIAWKIPWTEDPGRLQSMGSQRVGHNWATPHPSIHSFIYIYIYIYIFVGVHIVIHGHYQPFHKVTQKTHEKM